MKTILFIEYKIPGSLSADASGHYSKYSMTSGYMYGTLCTIGVHKYTL